jgi:hypothetical protein
LTHPAAFPGREASAACAPLIRPNATNETLAKRILFIVLPQAVVNDAFWRSHGLFTLMRSFVAGPKKIDAVCRGDSLK